MEWVFQIDNVLLAVFVAVMLGRLLWWIIKGE